MTKISKTTKKILSKDSFSKEGTDDLYEFYGKGAKKLKKKTKIVKKILSKDSFSKEGTDDLYEFYGEKPDKTKKKGRKK